MMTLQRAGSAPWQKPGLACGDFCIHARNTSINARYSSLITAILGQFARISANARSQWAKLADISPEMHLWRSSALARAPPGMCRQPMNVAT
jgi:hypothetical protein